MTRILQYGLGANQGGIERFLLDLSRHFQGSEFSFDFVYNDIGREPSFKKELAELGARFFPITPRNVSARKNARELDTILGSREFGALHAHVNTLSYISPLRAAIRHRVPAILHSHNSGASASWRPRLLHSWNRRSRTLKHTINLAVSPPAGQWLFGSHLGYEVLLNGIRSYDYRYDAEARKATREQLRLDADLVIGHIGAFLPAKNHAMVVRIFQALLKLHPTSRLLLVGAGPLEDQVRRQVRNAMLEDRVDFLGVRNDVPELLSAIDALLLPSLHEGFPFTALEGQASGLPCLISSSVTEEVNVTDRVHMIPKTAQPEVWASTLLEFTPAADRESAAAEIDRAGFDAARVATRLAEVYRGLVL